MVQNRVYVGPTGEPHAKKVAVIDSRESSEKAVVYREARRDKLLAKNKAMIQLRDTRDEEIHKINPALYEAEARIMR